MSTNVFIDSFEDNCQETLYRLDDNLSKIHIQKYSDTWTQIKKHYISILTDYQIIILMSKNNQYAYLSKLYLRNISTFFPKKFFYHPIENSSILEQYIIKAFNYGVKFWKYELKEDIRYNNISEIDKNKIFSSLDFIISNISYLERDAKVQREYYHNIVNVCNG